MTNTRKNKLGEMPIPKLIISMSVPMMLSFFIQALYNIVDSIFVARISEHALTAVSMAFPIQQLMTALGVGTGVAINALVSRYNGQKRPDKAEKIANVTVFLCFCYIILFLFIGMFVVRPYYSMQTDVAAIVEAGTQYLSIVCTISAGCFLGMIFEKMLVATGNSILSMTSQGTGAIVNIIFDPLLIFGIGPFPAMGVRGAAAATVLGQIVAAIVAFTLFTRHEKTIHLSFKKMIPDLAILKNIFSIALPSMITVGLGSIMSFGMNQILLAFSTTATAVFGIWMKLQNFCNMPIFGMNNGTVPILSFNYGAGRKDRVQETIHLATKAALILMLVLMVILELVPQPLLRVFNASDNMLGIGTIALRMAVASLPFCAFTLICSSAFQALNHSRYTMLLSILRQVVIMLPSAWLFALTGNLAMVWLSIPVTEVIGAAISFVLRKKLFAELDLH